MPRFLKMLFELSEFSIMVVIYFKKNFFPEDKILILPVLVIYFYSVKNEILKRDRFCFKSIKKQLSF